ncbi:hypothetical protein HED60_21710 [Planctomycetales bacterium ZRK34]|nr:hypothetical protein HED60_21710 [Planctomycetales bacterium ZRK34]
MNMNAQRRWIFAMALALAAGVTAPSLGQYQIPDGRQLDKNLQVGSGGYNQARQPNTAGAYQNALVTGNVGGLARFRGDIDYLAPGEFTAGTAADDTYLFRLQSMPQSVYSRGGTFSQGGVRGGQANQAYNTGQILQRSGAGVTSGQITGQTYRYDLPQVRRDDVTGWNAGSHGQLDRSIDSASLSQRPQNLGYAADAEGRLLQVSASPLIGITQRPIGRVPTGEGLQQLPSLPSNAADKASADSPDKAAIPSAAGDDSDAPRLDDKGDVVETNAVDKMARGRVSPLSLTPGLVIGQQINTAVNASVTNDSPAARFRTEDFEQLEREMFNPQGMAQVEAGKDVYMDLLQKIRQKDQPVATGPQPLADQLTKAPDDESEPAKSTTEKIAEQYEKTRQQVTGQPDPQTMNRLLNKLDYDAAPLTTLAGDTDREFDRQMRRAEQFMAKERYFDAENAFATSLALTPGDPMALVGRVNAQIGAGLYMTSSRNLRDLFSTHPELIAARYGEKLLPHGKRLLAIEDDLHDLLADNPQTDLPLVVAYLAYQQGKSSQVSHALNVLGTRRPNDPLIPLLKRIWVDQPDDDSPQDKP